MTLAVALHRTASGHFYTVVRLAEIEGEFIALAIPTGRYAWQERQFTNPREAFKTAREGGDVHPFVVEQDYAQRRCYVVKQIGG